MILSALKQYLSTCPEIIGLPFGVDFLGENPLYVSVYAEKGNPVLRRYVDGGAIFQFPFSFRMRARYGKNNAENEKINKLFLGVAAWIEKQSENGIFPEIGKDANVIDIEVLSGGYLKNTSAADCVYQMDCRILYTKGGRQ